MMKTEDICRVCSSRGDYDIFSAIPTYLHESPNEFLQWTDTISKLLEETTGLIVSPDDGLPQKMCALCISYLKHAATFRQQAINNTLSLKAVQMISSGKKNKIVMPGESIGNLKNGKSEDKCIEPVTMDDLIFNNTRKTDTNSLVNNVFNNQNKNDEYFKKFLLINDKMQNDVKCRNKNKTNNDAETSNLKSYLNLLFDKNAEKMPNTNRASSHGQSTGKQMYNKNDSQLETFVNNFFGDNDVIGDEFQTASSDDNDNYDQSMNYFNYKEKNFEEDDIMSLDVLKEANIIINIPEHFKERKCRACFRRFMFEESYNEHMGTCLEYKFLLLIEEINRLLAIRRSKAISPHEFIRRMIFSLKKTCQWLSTSCGEIFLPDLLVNGEVKKRTKSEGKSSGAENSSICRSDDNNRSVRENVEVLNKIEDVETSDSSLLNKTVIELAAKSNNVPATDPIDDNPLLKLLKEKADPSLIKNVCKSPDPLLDRLKNNGKMCMSTPITKIRAKSDGAASDSSVSYANSEKTFDHRAHRLHTIPSNIEIERKSLLESFNKVASKESLAPSVPYLMPLAPMYPKLNFSARCNACDTIFESIASLEEHNAKFHNNTQKIEKHKNIIALFEPEDNKTEIEGTVDVIQILNCNPLKPNNTNKVTKLNGTSPSVTGNDMKTVRCKDCDKHFSTIIHLDQHKLKFHTPMSAK